MERARKSVPEYGFKGKEEKEIDFPYSDSGMDKYAYREYMIKACYHNWWTERNLVWKCELPIPVLAMLGLPDFTCNFTYNKGIGGEGCDLHRNFNFSFSLKSLHWSSVWEILKHSAIECVNTSLKAKGKKYSSTIW